MAKPKTTKPKKPKTRPTHVLNANGNAFFDLRDLTPRDANTRTLCDRPFWYHTDAWRRERVIQIDNVANITNDDGYCRACLKIARMPEAARLALLAAQNKAKADRNEAAKLKRTDERTAELEAMDMRIEAARIDALVCLDYFEHNGTFLYRCDRVIDGQGGKLLRCDRPRGHVEMHYHSGTPIIDTGEVVTVAIEAIKRAKNKFDRGPKAWIFRTPPPYCRNCQERLFPEMLTTTHACRNCYTRIEKPHPGTDRTLVCRFCECPLLTNVKIGVEYRDKLILGAEYERPPTVGVHTTLCALKYLARVEETNQDDEPPNAKQLPSTSFVLTHDEDTNEETARDQ